MANTTVAGALAIHGKNPQFLVETVIRNRIYESNYWKEHCFALTAESLIDKAIEVTYIGGVYGNQRPTSFMCLVLKLLQIQPEKEILVEYLRAEEYLRALAALYIRLTFRAVDVYELLEPLLKDYSKIRLRGMGGYSLTFMDEYVYSLLTEERGLGRVVFWMQSKERAMLAVNWAAVTVGVEAEVVTGAELELLVVMDAILHAAGHHRTLVHDTYPEVVLGLARDPLSARAVAVYLQIGYN
ncbi:Pre-mRNA-splicing factor 38A [Termitomyces sp. J132]|nr:Pre-mRNA-splicing factor 38A [Termitomyces sp. J132]